MKQDQCDECKKKKADLDIVVRYREKWLCPPCLKKLHGELPNNIILETKIFCV